MDHNAGIRGIDPVMGQYGVQLGSGKLTVAMQRRLGSHSYCRRQSIVGIIGMNHGNGASDPLSVASLTGVPIHGRISPTRRDHRHEMTHDTAHTVCFRWRIPGSANNHGYIHVVDINRAPGPPWHAFASVITGGVGTSHNVVPSSRQ
jgi:hypothetical protein